MCFNTEIRVTAEQILLWAWRESHSWELCTNPTFTLPALVSCSPVVGKAPGSRLVVLSQGWLAQMWKGAGRSAGQCSAPGKDRWICVSWHRSAFSKEKEKLHIALCGIFPFLDYATRLFN